MTEFAMAFFAVCLFASVFGMLVPDGKTGRAVGLCLGVVLLVCTVNLVKNISLDLSDFSPEELVTEQDGLSELERGFAAALEAELDRVLGERFGCDVHWVTVDLCRDGEHVSVREIRVGCSADGADVLAFLQQYLEHDGVIIEKAGA